MSAAKTNRLAALVAAAAPIDGVSVGAEGDPTTVRVDFQSTATDAQKAAAQAVVSGFDWSDAAQSQWESDRFPDRRDLRAAAAAAIQANSDYVALAAPTNAQVVAQVRRLAQQNNAIVRRLVQID